MTSTEPAPPAEGWYPSPDGRSRWWDGTQWGAYAASPTVGNGSVAPSYGEPIVVQVPSQKEVGISYLLAILLGTFGAHRFYLRRVGTAVTILVLDTVGWILTVTVVGAIVGIPLLIAVAVWIIVDLFLIPGMVREANTQPVSLR